MVVYWSMFILSLVLAAFSYDTKGQVIEVDGKKEYRTKFGFFLFLMLYVAFFAGFRDVVQDTYAYRASFIATPTTWKGVWKAAQDSNMSFGFTLIQGCFKILISDSHYVWFLAVALLCCLCILRICYRYSVDPPLSGYLFIAMTSFTWLLNGMRQFIVVCVLFAFIDWLIQGKRIRYCVLAIGMTLIHSSAIFVIPIALLLSSEEKFLSKKTLFIVILAVIGTYFSEFALDFVGNFMEKDYSDSLDKSSGSSIMRFLVICVPAVGAFFGREKINKAPKHIVLAANMSVVAACFGLASTFTNGILVGRMMIYFSIYSLYLIPWLIKNIFKEDTWRIIWWACVLLYGVYFYYQMEIAWKGLPYISYFLGINQ